jgi:hypothetical protein
MLSLLLCMCFLGDEAQMPQNCKMVTTAKSSDINMKAVNNQEILKGYGLLGRYAV